MTLKVFCSLRLGCDRTQNKLRGKRWDKQSEFTYRLLKACKWKRRRQKSNWIVRRDFPLVGKMNELCYCCIIWTGWWRRLWPAGWKVKYKWLIPVSRAREEEQEREREPVCRRVTSERCARHLICSVLCLRHNPVFSTKSFSSLAQRTTSLTCLGSSCLSILIHSSVLSP